MNLACICCKRGSFIEQGEHITRTRLAIVNVGNHEVNDRAQDDCSGPHTSVEVIGHKRVTGIKVSDPTLVGAKSHWMMRDRSFFVTKQLDSLGIGAAWVKRQVKCPGCPAGLHGTEEFITIIENDGDIDGGGLVNGRIVPYEPLASWQGMLLSRGMVMVIILLANV